MFELSNIVGGYESSMVLRNVSLTVPSGEVVALLGPNGAGKSTTLQMASGLLRPKQGRVLLDGEDVTRQSPYQRTRNGLCHIFEGRGVFPSLTVRENLRMQTPKGKMVSEVVEQAVSEFPALGRLLGRAAGTLSGGEQQMVALVRAYVTEPRVVLVDEASLGLAPILVDGIFEFLARIASRGMALLIVEQYIHRALALASTVHIMSQGAITWSGPSSSLDQETVFALYRGATPEAEVH